MIAAARFPLRSDPAKSQFLRPRAHGQIWLSGSQTRLPASPPKKGLSFFCTPRVRNLFYDGRGAELYLRRVSVYGANRHIVRYPIPQRPA